MTLAMKPQPGVTLTVQSSPSATRWIYRSNHRHYNNVPFTNREKYQRSMYMYKAKEALKVNVKGNDYKIRVNESSWLILEYRFPN